MESGQIRVSRNGQNKEAQAHHVYRPRRGSAIGCVVSAANGLGGEPHASHEYGFSILSPDTAGTCMGKANLTYISHACACTT